MNALILAIETSCDETSAAVVRDGRVVLSNIISSQIPLHRRFNGVVPEVASRAHVESINAIINEALSGANCSLRDVDAIAVTHGPGLVGALLVGVSTAKALAYALQKPLIPVNHMDAHVSANYIGTTLEPPFICLVVSGGHSHIVITEDYGEYRLVGQTLDDAAGEAFDKTARVLGLPYPGGPELDRLAHGGDSSVVKLPRAKTDNPYDFSFSGLKTAFRQMKLRGELETYSKEDIAASLREAVAEPLIDKTIKAALHHDIRTVALAGGVSANSRIRELASLMTARHGMRLYYPPLNLCTDNAAMVGAAAYYSYARSNFSPAALSLNAEPSLQFTNK